MTVDTELLNSLKQVTIELKGTRERLRELERRAEEPIAIVGMSCRYPGGVESPEDLWDLVAEGRDGISPFPEDRGWPLDRLYDPDPDAPGTTYVREGGFVADATAFDASFFGFAPAEALGMDPQQRLLMEATWQALENAGHDPRQLRGTRTGVFVGLMYQDYGIGSPETVGSGGLGLAGGGIGGCAVSGGISYALDFSGPAVTVDTACSSSLVTIHLACQALRSGDCSLALAGGVTVLSAPTIFVMMARARGIAADARCKSFDAAADGTGWSEGVGVVALELLSDAERNGHEVLAVVRGSAVNQDGASNGLAAPNGPSQEKVIRQALANAGLGPADVDAVEAHGTGTTLGDPIEAQALLGTYGQGRDAERPLHLGAIKSNIGHTQAAAGVAGVIKMTMAMRKGVLPRSLHIEEPTPHVDWSAGTVRLLEEEMAWEPNGHPRRAGVSSFGVTGTNAHLILEEPPAAAAEVADDAEPAAPAETAGAIAPLLISAADDAARRESAARLHSLLLADPELERADLARALACDRPRLARRAAVGGADREALLAGLAALARGEEADNVATGNAAETVSGPVFLFPGQGSQWRRMALDLLDSAPVFARSIDACEEALEPHIEWSLRSVLRREEGAADLERVDVVQPVLFSMMVSLAALWRSAGVEPVAVMGHSQGELAAAAVAGALPLEHAAQLVALRSQVLEWGAEQGGMALVAIGAEELDQRVPIWRKRVALAGVNGPNSIVISGGTQGLREVLALCEEAGIWTYKIRAAVGAGHSPAVEFARPLLMETAEGIEPRNGEVPFYSCFTAGPVDGADLDAEYWYRNAREPVLFGPTISLLLSQGYRHFVEVSPNPILMVPLNEAFQHDLGAAASEASFTPTLIRKKGSLDDFGLAVGRIWSGGVEVDWDKALAPARRRVQLPPYPFQREPFWPKHSGEGEGDLSMAGQAVAEHPLLAAAVPQAEGEGLLFTGRLALETHPWLGDHGGMGTALLPGTAFVDLALHAGAETDCELLRELTLQAPLLLPERGGVQVQLVVSAPDEDGQRTLAFYGRPEGDEEAAWTRHATALLEPAADAPAVEPSLAGEWPPPGAQPLDLEAFYDELADLGVEYGPAFQGLTAAWRRDGELFVEVALGEDEALAAPSFGLHPALLDAVVHSLASSYVGPDAEEEAAGPSLPFAFTDVRLGTPGLSRLRARLARGEGDERAIAIADDAGAPVASIGALVTRPLPAAALAAPGGAAEALFALEWAPLEAEGPTATSLALLGAVPERLTAALGDVPAYADVEALAAAIDAGVPVPEAAIFAVPSGPADEAETLAATHATATAALAVGQSWLADERLVDSRLVFLTEGALAVAEGERPDLSQAAVWGLIRSAQNEHPERLALLDRDGGEPSLAALAAAVGLGEPQLALRDGKHFGPRLRRAGEPATAPPAPLDPEGTVLVTGGSGDLGGFFSRHLVEAHGARRLLLVSRSGAEAEGAAELGEQLRELGAEVEFASCDVGDREQLAALLETIDPAHPLTGVVHTAAVLHDGVFTAMTPEQVETVLGPKADAAWHLHELTAGMDLRLFALFASASGTFGRPGQANYAAANAFLDALAARRAAAGLPALALAWGIWERTLERVGVTLDDEQRAILARSGYGAIGDEEGLELFDGARADGRPVLVAAPLHLPAWRAMARAGELPSWMADLVRAPGKRAAGARAEKSLQHRLAAVPEEERQAAVLDYMREQMATVLGLESKDEVDPQTPLLELGFDSLTALQYRNRLMASTGLKLTPTVVLDYPTTEALAGHVLSQIEVAEGDPDGAAGGEAAGESSLLSTLMRSAYASGRTSEFLALLDRLAAFRPRFQTLAEGGVEPYSLRLAEGPARPQLVCVPSAAPISGPHEYAKLARHFRGDRDLLALRWPGFASMEELPADPALAVELQLATLDALGTESPVLLGHSTGGVFAYAMARRLEQQGRPPAAVVLVDSYDPAQMRVEDGANSIGLGILGGLLGGGESSIVIDDARLTAMAAYLRMVFDLELEPVAVPTLLLRATEPIGEAPDGDGWQADWAAPHEVRDAPGNHLSMMDAHVEEVAAAVSEWLRTAVDSAHDL